MGYHTEFSGSFAVTPALKPEHIEYLRLFSRTRRLGRNASKAAALHDPVREAAGLPIGEKGAYFTGGTGFYGQDRDPSVLDSNHAPLGQPGLWCMWTPSDDGTAIEWDGGEKFYNYTEWMAYILEHFIKPWGYTLNGGVTWDGEERGDLGLIAIEDNAMTVKHGYIEWRRRR